MSETYLDHVRSIERGLGPFAFRSEGISTFTDGTDAFKYFEDVWKGSDGQARLAGRTPLTLERDRILYSDELRRQADKHHFLFFMSQRVNRDYMTHTLRVAHVARSVCARLGLNIDLAEAIALGCKVGGVPFLHVSKNTVDGWVREKLRAIDATRRSREPGRDGKRSQGVLLDVAEEGPARVLPIWLQQIQSESARSDVARFVPFGTGNTGEPAYSSGQLSYWLLNTNPYLLIPKSRYTPQTMYGIWRHSLSTDSDAATFHHEIRLTGGETYAKLSISDKHLTHEAAVVRYADLCRRRHKSAYAEARVMPTRLADALVRAVDGVLMSA